MKRFTANDIEGNTIHARSLDLIHAPLPWQSRGLSFTASGYGAKIPTRYRIHFEGRERRVYSTVYSNVGSAWITYCGHKIHIDTY